MGLSKKTFCYSSVLAAVMILFVVGYFIFMLPSLYVDYVARSNLNSIINTHNLYLEKKSYEDAVVRNPTGSFTLDIPGNGNSLVIVSRFYRLDITVTDDKIMDTLNELRGWIMNPTQQDGDLSDIIDFDELSSRLLPDSLLPEDYPLKIKFSADTARDEFHQLSSKMHVISDDFYVFEGTVEDSYNQYTSYIAASVQDDSLIISFLPVMTPQLDEIRPVVAGSVPMLTAVVFLLVLLSSGFFSRRIIAPILRISDYADRVNPHNTESPQPLSVTGKDEISTLARALNSLYAQVWNNYQELEEKNKRLSDSTKRQEVFLRASSHQLKTPIAAALLLTDGMINQIGKYQDVMAYLPEIKRQLKSMQKITEDILSLNDCIQDYERVPLSLDDLAADCLGPYQISACEKRLSVSTRGYAGTVTASREIAGKIIDNLLSNAVAHTPQGNEIIIHLSPGRISIQNYGAHIEEDLLPDIYEPFVSSSTQTKGHGLGLYIASYYARLTGCELQISNTQNGVFALLAFPEEAEKSCKVLP